MLMSYISLLEIKNRLVSYQEISWYFKEYYEIKLDVVDIQTEQHKIYV